MSSVTIRTADVAELAEIVKFIDEQFVKNEPIISAYQPSEEYVKQSPANDDDDDDTFVKSCIENGTTFVAHLGEELVGILVAGRIGPNEHELTLSLADANKDQKFADIMRLVSYVERKADVCNRYGVPESLHLHLISVHENHFGNGIATKLFTRCFEEARAAAAYPALSVDCTNIFTARIAKKLGMELLATVTYDEINRYMGAQRFFAREPNVSVQSFGLKF